ncbi:MAG: glycosyltransferase family 39 protein [Candidatus Acidiferrales bacterium]
MAQSGGVTASNLALPDTSRNWFIYLAIVLIVGAIYIGCIVSPPSVMDDVDAVHAQMARTMLTSGDWVTARIDGVPYFEKAPFVYWTIAITYKIFGVHDWAARIPIALSAVGLCLLTAAFGIWAFGKRAGFYAGLCLATCVGLFLFTRILIPDVMLTFTTALAMWGFLRAIDKEEPHPRLWAFLLAASLGVGLLLKSLIAVVFPAGTAIVYLLITRQFFSREIWKRLHPISGALVLILIAAPWHILATIRNPPYFAWTLHSGPNKYHGFLWFFVINEQLLRFMNRRYPRDYNTVPRLFFWLFHLIWLFPWSVYFPAAAKLSFKPVDRAGRTRLLALCWLGFVLVFFTFSTTQEYYSMPCYPAFALLLGSAMAANGPWVRRGTRALAITSAVAALAAVAIYWNVRDLPAPGDISDALSRNPSAYSLSLGHMLDLTFPSFAYLRTPLVLAALAFLVGAIGSFRATGLRAFLAAAVMMVLFLHAARLALVVFDPYLSSRPLANALMRSPEGTLISEGHYYSFSSVFFYANRTGLLWNGRAQNLEYGSNAPGAPDVFVNDAQLKSLWAARERYYLLAMADSLPRLQGLMGYASLNLVLSSGGKVLLTNEPLPQTVPGAADNNTQP